MTFCFRLNWCPFKFCRLSCNSANDFEYLINGVGGGYFAQVFLKAKFILEKMCEVFFRPKKNLGLCCFRLFSVCLFTALSFCYFASFAKFCFTSVFYENNSLIGCTRTNPSFWLIFCSIFFLEFPLNTFNCF